MHALPEEIEQNCSVVQPCRLKSLKPLTKRCLYSRNSYLMEDGGGALGLNPGFITDDFHVNSTTIDEL